MRKILFTAALLALLAAGQTAAARRSGTDFQATITGRQEVPSVETSTSGRIDLRLWTTSSGGRIKWSLVIVNRASPVIAALVQRGRPGQNGPVLATLCHACRRPAGGTFHVSRSIATTLLHRATYINVETQRHPHGEIRGALHRNG
jgi:hypothetical protein